MCVNVFDGVLKMSSSLKRRYAMHIGLNNMKKRSRRVTKGNMKKKLPLGLQIYSLSTEKGIYK